MVSQKSAQAWYLYLIKNNLGQYYCGVTTDVERRFNEHAASGVKCAKALRGKGPLSLCFQAQLSSRRHALQAEYWVKQQSVKVKQAIIAGTLMLPDET